MYIVPQLSTNIIYLRCRRHCRRTSSSTSWVTSWYPTPLRCNALRQSSAPAAIAAASTGSVTSPACSAGYTLSGGSCDSTSFSMSLVSHEASGGNTSWFCSANNTGGSSAKPDRDCQLLSRSRQIVQSQLTQQLLRLGRDRFFEGEKLQMSRMNRSFLHLCSQRDMAANSAVSATSAGCAAARAVLLP